MAHGARSTKKHNSTNVRDIIMPAVRCGVGLFSRVSPGLSSKLAMDLHEELPKELRHLAWLDLDSEAGRECWLAWLLI